MKALLLLLVVGLFVGCGGREAGSACTSTEDCPDGQACLTQFKGGYCGVLGCTDDEGCPDKTICVKEGSTNYCFLSCENKDECNADRASDVEANCSSNIEHIGSSTSKACVPPSG